MKIEYKYNYKYNPKSNRLHGYDYSENWAYFITICCKDRQEYFWEIIEGKMILNKYWEVVKKYYFEMQDKYDYIVLDEFVIMPNHIHFIIFIEEDNEWKGNKWEWEAINGHLYIGWNKWWFAKEKNCMLENWIWKVINWYKWRCSFDMNNKNNFDVYFAWQKNYYDRIIRNEDELQKVREYIVNNPLKWELNKDNEQWIFI